MHAAASFWASIVCTEREMREVLGQGEEDRERETERSCPLSYVRLTEGGDYPIKLHARNFIVLIEE